MIRTATGLILSLLGAPIGSEMLDVRGLGPVDLAPFECRDVSRSTIIQRVCYDRAESTMIVAIRGAYDRYCNLPVETFDSFVTAPSMGQFFNRNIKGSDSGRRYGCPANRRAGY